jgi:hypothetical protein
MVSGENPQTYPFAFMNITSDREETGFIQIYGFSINQTELLVEGRNDSFHQFSTVAAAGTIGQSQTYNLTPTFNHALRAADIIDLNNLATISVSNFGIVASSKDPMYVIGGKSDKGTTDAFMALPVMQSSKEFFINIVAALDDTCVEVYKVFNGNQMVLIKAGSISKYQVFRYFAQTQIKIDGVADGINPEDVTGYFVNASKAIEVYFGHECAWVPTTAVLFCDYMVEQIPPANQLGKRFVAPGIIGRSSGAGYILRAVATKQNTKIGYTGGPTVDVPMGQFIEIDWPMTDTSCVVTCSEDCLVMQYNKGYLMVQDDVPTDPFMMLVVSDERWTAGSGFATPNFCLDRNSLIQFNNFVTITTFASIKDNIRFDDQPLTSYFPTPVWTPLTANGVNYAVTSFRITHGFHYVNLAPGTFGSFAVYVYGHSQIEDSSSAYGFSSNYNITGEPISRTYEEGLKKYQDDTNPGDELTCSSEQWLTGAIISSSLGQYVPFPFTLRSSINPAVTLSPVCLSKYQQEILKLLRDFSRQINKWICLSKNCSYLNGRGVAIDYSSLKVTFIGSGGIYTAVEVYVEMIASLDVTSKNYATCRAEIKNYMYYFVNWPPMYSPNLVGTTIAGCPYPLDFVKPQFDVVPNQCPVSY